MDQEQPNVDDGSKELQRVDVEAITLGIQRFIFELLKLLQWKPKSL